MKRKKSGIFLLLFMLLIYLSDVSAQQLPRFSQYYDNEFLINPSFAGVDGRTIVNLTARKQWVGFTANTPGSYMISAQGRILKSGYSLRENILGGKTFNQGKSGRVGIGGIMYHDQNGAIQRTGAQFSYAYHIFINQSQLSLGLTASAFQYRINPEDAVLKSPENDPLSGLIGKSTLVPDAGIGINYMASNWHMGIAVSQLFQSKLKIGNNADYHRSEDIRLRRHYFLLADYCFTLPNNSKWEVQPSTIILANELLNINADISLKVYWNRHG